mgnify:CR=1 FL=1
MYLHSNFSRGLLDLATPLFAEIEQNHTPDFAEEDGKYIFEVEMPGGIFKLTLNKKHKHKPKEIEIK